MNSVPKLSIIIPVYNGETYLEDTVTNLLCSTYSNLELLLIDDGSTDRSPSICDRLAESNSRIKVYHKENGGIADARNYGLIHATGDYVGFCDQDDEVSHEMYQKMIDRIMQDGSQAAVCGCYRQKRNGMAVIFEHYTDNIFTGQSIQKKLLLPMLFQGFNAHTNEEIRIYPTIWKCIISKSLIDDRNMRFHTFVNYEDDFIMLLQLFLQADKISTLSDILYYWNTNIHSESHRSTGNYLQDLETRQRNLLDYVVKELTTNGIANDIIRQYTYVQQCRNALLQLDNLAALKTCKNSRETIRMLKELRSCDSILFIQSATEPVNPARGFIRNNVIIPLIRRKHIVIAFLLNQLIDNIRFFVEKNHITEKLERRLKKTSGQ